MIAWEIPFEIVDESEAALERKIAAFVGWCARRGTEARVARQQDLGPQPDGRIRRMVEFELRSERFQYEAAKARVVADQAVRDRGSIVAVELGEQEVWREPKRRHLRGFYGRGC